MATLEVHDAGRRVRRIRITRETPVMFGSDPMCEVVLDGPGVRPFHGRIRWKTRRFKVEASPDVPFIEVNGAAVKSSSLYQGDEIRVGVCRIFLLSTEDGPDHGEKTVVRPHRDAPAAETDRPRPVADLARMEMAPPSVESTASVPPPVATPDAPRPRTRRRSRRKVDAFSDLEKLEEQPEFVLGNRPASRPIAERIKSLVPRFQPAPGDDRVFTSPVVRGLVVAFLLLVFFSVVLYRGISRTLASRLYNVAVEDMDKGDFLNATREFDRFIKANPEDSRASKAQVLQALARVRQHTGKVGASWGTALTEAQAMVDEVGQKPEYRDLNMDLAEDIRKAAAALADRSASLADPETLAQAEAAVRLHARVAGPQAAGSLIDRSRIPEKLEKARAAILKSQARASALASMDAALKANRPDEAYAARDALTVRYQDLAGDKEVIARLIRANDLIRQAVTLDPSGRPGETEPHTEPLGPATSLALRLDPKSRPPDARGPTVYALADGLAVGLDAATGAPLWQVPVGVSSPFPPMAIAGDAASALVVDARFDELVRLDGRTGSLVWRQETGGPVVDPPLILGNMILQPTPDGRLLQLDLASGELRGTLKLGRRLTRTPVADDSAQHLYQLADRDCLFILTLGPPACVAVEYLGHDAGSVPCPPARIARYFVLPENHGPETGRWRVFVIDEAGTKLKMVQEVPVGGWTRSTPASAGPVIWSSTDRGELAAFTIGLYDAKVPFVQVARLAGGDVPEGPAFGRARSDRDFTLASSRSGRYELDLQRGKLATTWTLGQAGPALAEPQMTDRLLVLTQQHQEGPGTALWGVDPASGEVRWRTVLGATWPLPLSESSTRDALSGLSFEGEAFSIERGRLTSGGFVELPLPRLGRFRIPPAATQHLEVNGLAVVVPALGSSTILVRDAPAGEFRLVALPAPLGAAVAAMGSDLLIPGGDGRLYLIDPKSGASTADPYVPPFDKSRPIQWRKPVVLGGNAVALANADSTLRRISVDRSSRPRLVATSEVRLDSPLQADPASTGASVVVATLDGRVRSLAARDLSPQGSWPLGGARQAGPVVVAEHAFVVDAEGEVMAFGPDGRRLWSSRLRNPRPVGPPAIRDGSAWFLGSGGTVERLSMLDGSVQANLATRCLPDGGPLAAGPDLVVPTGPGTLRLLDRTSLGASPERLTP